MSFVFFSLVVLIITLIIWSYSKNRRHNELLSRIPAPKQLPLISHAGYFFNKRPEEILENVTKFAKALGPVFYTKIPGSTQIFVYDPKIIEIFLTSQKLITKSAEYELLLPWMGTGLLTSTNQKWHQRRKIITPAFHFKILEDFVDVMERQGNIFVEKLRNLQGREIDVFPLVSLYALDVICGMIRL
jgi:cytochrome P450 family 4